MMNSNRQQFGKRREPVQIVIASGSDVRSFSVRPWLATALAMFAVVFTVTYLAATSYLVFRDDLISFAEQRADRMRHDYEDRIAYLRSQIDKMTSRRLVDQETLETKLELMLRRQEELSSRHEVISSVLDLARTSGLNVPVTLQRPPAKPSKATIATDALFLRSGTAPEVTPGDGSASGEMKPRAGLALPDLDLETASRTVDQMTFEASIALDAVRVVAEKRTRAIADALRTAGLSVTDTDSAEDGALGGPFVPADEDEEFFVRAERTRVALQSYLAIKASLHDLPIAMPIPGAPIASGYGRRLDPFLKRPAMHTGLDYKARRGQTVRAAANGKVIVASRHGGYGNMVEIAHANGLTTRYAHLSRISVKAGQRVTKGAPIGAVGSTGRSTGPHLHYEVRIGERPADPLPFVRAGRKILAMIGK